MNLIEAKMSGYRYVQNLEATSLLGCTYVSDLWCLLEWPIGAIIATYMQRVTLHEYSFLDETKLLFSNEWQINNSDEEKGYIDPTCWIKEFPYSPEVILNTVTVQNEKIINLEEQVLALDSKMQILEETVYRTSRGEK